jgi:hypothetical protein
LHDQWKESIILPIHKKGDKTDWVITAINFIQNFIDFLLSRLRGYIDGIIGDHQYGFRRNRSTTDQVFCIHQILEKKWEYNETEILYNIHIEFGLPMKLGWLIKILLN